jgi:hypothetical protein
MRTRSALAVDVAILAVGAAACRSSFSGGAYAAKRVNRYGAEASPPGDIPDTHDRKAARG